MGKEKTYKVLPYKVHIHHGDTTGGEDPWDFIPDHETTETRYCVVSTETGEVLDDAQGYGYKTAQKAHAAYAYKNRDRSRDQEHKEQKKRIRAWMKEHKYFVSLMDACALDLAKGSCAPGETFNAGYVRQLLKEEGLEPDFSAGELLKEWRKR